MQRRNPIATMSTTTTCTCEGNLVHNVNTCGGNWVWVGGDCYNCHS